MLKYLFLMIGVGLSAFYAVNVQAQGNLVVMPKRIVFDGSKRFEEVNLSNIGKDTATYVISFIQIRMKEDGNFENISEPDSGQMFANKFLRFYPRQVTLAPNETQSIKVQINRTSEMARGEYRSHMYFRAVPKTDPLGETPAKQDSGISIVLTPIFGISIPAIIRNGESDAKVSISDLAFSKDKEGRPGLQMSFNRSGNMSVYGDLKIELIAPDGKVTKVGDVKGISVYTPTKVRKFLVALEHKDAINYDKGKLRVTYFDGYSKKSVLAEAELALDK